MPRKGTQKKTSLMGINFSRDKKQDMSQILESNDLDGIAEYDVPLPSPVLFLITFLFPHFLS